MTPPPLPLPPHQYHPHTFKSINQSEPQAQVLFFSTFVLPRGYLVIVLVALKNTFF